MVGLLNDAVAGSCCGMGTAAIGSMPAAFPSEKSDVTSLPCPITVNKPEVS